MSVTILTSANEVVSIIDEAAPPSADIVSLGLFFGKSGLLPFAFGQTFKRGDVPSGAAVIADCAEFQCFVVNYYDDGSWRDANVAGYVNVPAPSRVTINMKLGPLAVGNVSLAAPAVKVEINGVLITQLERTVEFIGPVAGQERIRARLDKLTWVEWEQRTFRNGEIEILVPEIWNAGFLTPTQSNRILNIRITINNEIIFDNTVDVKHHTHPALLNGFRWTTWINGDQSLLPDHDRTYLCSCESFPPYTPKPASTVTLATLPQTYTTNYIGEDGPSMSKTGYRPSIGLLARANTYMLTTGGFKAWNYMWTQALALGSWSIHYIDESTGEIPVLSNYPKHGWRESGQFAVPSGSGLLNGQDDRAHHYSACYTAAKLTGWRRFRDEHLQWIVRNHMSQWASIRGNEKGLLKTDVGANQVRGAAWGLRTLFQGISLAKHDHPLLPDLLNIATENLHYYAQRYVDGTLDGGKYINNLGVFAPYSAAGGPSPYTVAGSTAYWDAPWQQVWVTLAFGQALQMKLPLGPQANADLKNVFEFGAKLIIGMCGDGGQNAFNWRRFACYDLPIGPDGTKSPAIGGWYINFGLVRTEYERAKNLSALDPALGGDIKQHSTNVSIGSNDWTEGRHGFHWPTLVYAVMHKVSGADTALARIMSSSSWPLIAAGIQNPLWAGMMPPGVIHPGA